MRISDAQGKTAVFQLNTARTNPYFVGVVAEVTTESVVVTDAHSIVFNEDGNSFNLMPLNPLGKEGEEYEIPRALIITIAEADEQFEGALRKVTSGIELASANQMPKS